MPNRSDRLAGARLYLVCDERSDDFLDAVLGAGVDIVQLRLKGASDEHVLTTARRYADMCAARDVLLILNDRPDLVAAAGADGVHVGQDDMSVADARALVGPDRLIGLSTHTPQQVDGAALLGVDYIGVGPVHATPTKPGRPAVGLELVRYAAARAPVPFFAIGGIDTTNIAAVVASGAGRVAVVRALTQAGDPAQTAQALRGALTAGVRVGVGAGAGAGDEERGGSA